MRDVKKFMEEMRARNPQLQEEYDRLGPRYAAISELIRARKRAGITQADLGRRMGVSQAVVARLESADHSPKIDTLAQAARALGFRVDVKFVRERKRSNAT